MKCLEAFVGVARAPRQTLRSLAEASSWRPGLWAVLTAGALWAVFLLWLHRGGHTPSGPLVVPIERADYYLYQAVFVTPALVAMWLGACLAGHAVARRFGGLASPAQTASPIGYALATPFVLAWLLPDVLVLAIAGFGGMAAAMRVYVPISTLWTLALLYFALRAAHRIDRGPAVIAALAAFVVQSAIGAPLIR